MRTHDPFAVVLLLDGALIQATGRDDFVRFSEIPDESVNAVGIDGQVTNTVIRNTYRVVEITANRQSNQHRTLAAKYEIWKLTLKRGRFAFSYVNPNNGDTAIGLAWFLTTPDMGTGREDSDVVWRLALSANIWTFAAGGAAPLV